MTDYLERLLDMRQEEEETEPFAWKRTGRGYRNVSGKDGAQQVMDREKTEAERTDGWGERPREKETPAQKRVNDPETRLAVLERAVARGKVQQATQEWKRGRTEAAQAAGGQDMRGLTVTVPEMRRSLAGALDAVFERDARRYDGPLGLF